MDGKIKMNEVIGFGADRIRVLGGNIIEGRGGIG